MVAMVVLLDHWFRARTMRPRWRSDRPEAIEGASLATAALAEDGDPAGLLPREE